MIDVKAIIGEQEQKSQARTLVKQAPDKRSAIDRHEGLLEAMASIGEIVNGSDISNTGGEWSRAYEELTGAFYNCMMAEEQIIDG